MMLSRRALSYIVLMIASGAMVVGHGVWDWQSSNPVKYLSYLLISLAAGGIKVRLPRVTATMSLNFLFVLIGIDQFSLAETLVMGCLGGLVQSLFHARTRPTPVQIAFNLGSLACAIQSAWLVRDVAGAESGLLTAAVFFLANTLSVTGVIALTESKNAFEVWRSSYFWSFPNYLVGATVAWVVAELDRGFGWQVSIFLFPFLYFVSRYHKTYVERIEEASRRADEAAAHAAEVATMHRRTVETLALAVEARDQNTHAHLERVEAYALEVARELGVGEAELDALRTAALLHDVGKLAVPEAILSKPGRLTPEEFAVVKTHTIVGAEIVERMCLRPLIASMVRGHHEKWDGSGYPDGLCGEEIPLGARILAAVDFLDALSSERSYRKPIAVSETVELICAESGKSFDPRVAEVIERRYQEIERIARSSPRISSLPLGVQVSRGAAPAAGYAGTRELMDLNRAVGEGALKEAIPELSKAGEPP